MDIQLLRRLAVSLPMVLVFTIWQAMFMNGVRIGIKKTTMADRQSKNQPVLIRASGEFCVVDLGVTT